MKVENGRITRYGKPVGTAVKDLRYGYHPSIRVNVGDWETWFEIDEKGLKAKIVQFAREVTSGKP